MRISWRSEWPNWAVIAGMWIVAALAWGSTPDRVPVHWNWQGEVDRHGGKVEGMLLLPAMTLGIYLLFLVLPRMDPARANYEKFAWTYGIFRLVFTVSMALIYGVMLLSANGYPVDTALVMPVIVGGLLVVIGNFMGKLRPNWFIGIRTPWTLASQRSWTRTHRMGGRLFVLCGLLLMLSGVVRTPWVMAVMWAAFMGLIAWVFIYSYLEWRKDPDRRAFWGGNGGEAR